jgi:hypothetical protein
MQALKCVVMGTGMVLCLYSWLGTYRPGMALTTLFDWRGIHRSGMRVFHCTAKRTPAAPLGNRVCMLIHFVNKHYTKAGLCLYGGFQYTERFSEAIDG